MRGKEHTSKGEEFDRSVFRDEMNLVSGRMNPEGFRHFEVEGENKYETVDREGKKLTILVYKKVMRQNAPYELDGWYLFAIQNGAIVGYTGAHVEGYLEEGFVEAKTSYSVVCQKGKGIGGALEKINDLLMQGCANKYGDLKRVETDANKSLIEDKLGESGVAQDLISEMLVSRWLWLELYRPNGKRGFSRENDYEVTKTYRQSGGLPDVGIKKSKNQVPIGSITHMINKWLEDDC